MIQFIENKKKYYPQVFFFKYKYVVKEISSDDSNNEDSGDKNCNDSDEEN